MCKQSDDVRVTREDLTMRIMEALEEVMDARGSALFQVANTAIEAIGEEWLWPEVELGHIRGCLCLVCVPLSDLVRKDNPEDGSYGPKLNGDRCDSYSCQMRMGQLGDGTAHSISVGGPAIKTVLTFHPECCPGGLDESPCDHSHDSLPQLHSDDCRCYACLENEAR